MEESSFLNIILSAFGATLVIIIGLLVKLLWSLVDRQSASELKIGSNSILVTRIENQEIPTIQIQIKNLDERTDKIEHKQEMANERIKWIERNQGKGKHNNEYNQ